jgi:hypothetical protein
VSDTSQGEGWWQASDGKWYPPEQHPDVQQPTQPIPQTPAPQWQPPGPAGPPAGLPPGATKNNKWVIPAIAAGVAVIGVAIVAFLLLRDDDGDTNVATATDNSDQTTDSSSSASSRSSSSKSSSASSEFVDPVGVEDRLLTASDIGSEFTDETFTPSTATEDPCGNPNSRTVVPPTKDVGSTATEASSDKVFEQEVLFHETAADNREAFNVALDTFHTCTDGTLSDGTPFTLSTPEDVSSEVGVTEAFESTAEVGDTTVISVGVRLDNCVVSFTFQYPTSAGESGKPDATGIASDGIDLLLS